MATKTVTMGTATIGPSIWRNDTLKNIKLSQNGVQRSDKSAEMGKGMDPLPNLRETLLELSNNEAHTHFRSTRSVVVQLRECLIETNEEVKSLTRAKEALEKAIDNTRKDIQLNQDSQNIRHSRPQREKETDGADDLLKAEKQQLQNLKRMQEAQLNLVRQQLHALDHARKRLANVISERSRVLDLICHALPGGSVSASTSSFSARAWRSRTTMSADFERSNSDMGNKIDPLGSFTPEVEAAMDEAREARSRSAMLRREVADMVGRVGKVQNVTKESVNSGLIGKIGETVQLKQHLDVVSAENRHAINRAHRWFDQTEKAWGYSRGPLYSGDMMGRERLDRPIISTFQRHPGTNVPEAQEIVRSGDGLLQSLQSTSRNIGLLKLAQLRLKEDVRDKNLAINVDSSIVRMRRRKGNHRWVMGQAY